MISFKKILFALMAFGFVVAAGLDARAGSLGSRDDALGFFGRPYPYGYAYHQPRDECYRVETFETPDGPARRLVNICEEPLHSRY